MKTAMKQAGLLALLTTACSIAHASWDCRTSQRMAHADFR